MFRVLPILSVLIPLSGCLSDSNAESPLPESEYQELNRGAYTVSGTFTEKQVKVITSQASYNEELVNYTSEIPTIVDFSQGKVLLVDMGQRNSGGYSIGVSSISVEDNYIVAGVVLSSPGQNCAVTLALTNPYQFVFIPTNKEILVSESLTVYDCAE